jgi:uncharacterized damage-inducible protein DinB
VNRPGQFASLDLGHAAGRIFAANDRMNQVLIEHLDPGAWKAKLALSPRRADGTKRVGNLRTIAAIFTHMHNVRTKWIRLTAPHLKVPAQLSRTRATPEEVRAGLAESATRCAQMLAEALGAGDGRIQKFWRDGWAQPWPIGRPAGPEMLCYMLMHEAHHRGQVCMLAHQLGFPLPAAVANGIWNWEKLWQEMEAPARLGNAS